MFLAGTISHFQTTEGTQPHCMFIEFASILLVTKMPQLRHIQHCVALIAGFLNLTITPSKPPSVLLGDYISLNCSPVAPTSEDISYTWTHLNTSTVLGETSNILTFPRISLEQLGTYRCTVSSTSGGAEITINSASKGGFPMLIFAVDALV